MIKAFNNKTIAKKANTKTIIIAVIVTLAIDYIYNVYMTNTSNREQ
jgi:hypothetical protein